MLETITIQGRTYELETFDVPERTRSIRAIFTTTNSGRLYFHVAAEIPPPVGAKFEFLNMGSNIVKKNKVAHYQFIVESVAQRFPGWEVVAVAETTRDYELALAAFVMADVPPAGQ
jgi:hypothetical protein